MEFSLGSAKNCMSGKSVLEDYPQIQKSFKIRIEDRKWFQVVYITINSLEDMLKLIKIVGCKLVVDEDEIIIYDDYLE